MYCTCFRFKRTRTGFDSTAVLCPVLFTRSILIMFNIQNLRLSSLRHIQPFNRLSDRLTPRHLSFARQSSLFKMDSSAASSRTLASGASVPTLPTRDYLGFYTYFRSRPHLSGSSKRSSRPSARRHYSSGYGGYGHHAKAMFTVDQAFWVLFGLNSISFATWWYARLTHNNSLMQTHISHTLTSLASLDRGHYWTVLTSAFTHHDPMHFAFNMLTLRTFCQIVGYVPGIGGWHIISIALASALAGSGGWLWQQKQKLASLSPVTSSRWANGRSSAAATQAYHGSALGASGSVMGVGAVATCLLPNMPITLMLIPIGIPLWIITAGYAVVDSYYLDSATSRVAHSGHLGGLVAGAAYYALLLRKSPVGVWNSLVGRLRR